MRFGSPSTQTRTRFYHFSPQKSDKNPIFKCVFSLKKTRFSAIFGQKTPIFDPPRIVHIFAHICALGGGGGGGGVGGLFDP